MVSDISLGHCCHKLRSPGGFASLLEPDVHEPLTLTLAWAGSLSSTRRTVPISRGYVAGCSKVDIRAFGFHFKLLQTLQHGLGAEGGLGVCAQGFEYFQTGFGIFVECLCVQLRRCRCRAGLEEGRCNDQDRAGAYQARYHLPPGEIVHEAPFIGDVV